MINQNGNSRKCHCRYSIDGGTNDYDEFLEMMSTASTDEPEYFGITIIVKKNAVNRLAKHCEMFLI